jgi:serine-type D-Ala-D-Ala carboxypeptidase
MIDVYASDSGMSLEMIHEEMNSGIREEIFTGGALFVSSKKKDLFHETYGTLGGLGTDAVSRHTLFDLASLTKILATTCAWMILASKHPGLLDEPIDRWFPHCSEDKAHITPRMLLAHASGLPAWRPYYLFASSDLSMPIFVREEILSEDLVYRPGLGCVYSDLGFMLLGFIIEIETGMELKAFMREFVFKPLGVGDELLFKPKKNARGIALTRCGDPPGLVNDLNCRALGGITGHAGLFGTAPAVGRPAQEVVAALRGESPIFDREVAETFCSTTGTRALGFDVRSAQGSSSGTLFSARSLGHTGFTGTSLWIDLDREIVVVLLTNRVFFGEADLRIKEFRPRLHDAVIKSLVAG